MLGLCRRVTPHTHAHTHPIPRQGRMSKKEQKLEGSSHLEGGATREAKIQGEIQSHWFRSQSSMPSKCLETVTMPEEGESDRERASDSACACGPRLWLTSELCTHLADSEQLGVDGRTEKLRQLPLCTEGTEFGVCIQRS